MTIRFFRRVTLLPGLRVNLSKSGASLSAPAPPCEHYVYQIRACDDGRVVYVGMGKLKRCYAKHRKNSDINALIDAGGTHLPEIIAGPMTREEAWSLEIEMIAKHKRTMDGGQLLNLSTGGRAAGDALRGRKLTPERVEKIVATLRGKTPSAETRAKISAAKKGRPRSAETRAKLAAILAERNRSPEHRAKLSAAMMGNPSPNKGKSPSAETRAKQSAAKKGKPLSAEHRAKVADALRGRKLSPEAIAKRVATRRGGVPR